MAVPARGLPGARFRARFELLSRLRHPHILPVHALHEGEEHPYALMELLSGTLSDRLRSAGALEPEHAMLLLDPVLDALAHAHREGITHGALALDSVVFTAEGELRLLGFSAEGAEPVSDICAFGELLRAVLTWQEPGARIPEQLQHVIERATEGRYPSIRALRVALWELRGALPTAAPAPVVVAPPDASLSPWKVLVSSAAVMFLLLWVAGLGASAPAAAALAAEPASTLRIEAVIADRAHQ